MNHTLPDLPCYLNGEFTTLPHAKVSVMDRGFIFGDGVYEVVPVYAGRPFRFDDHLARLGRSLRELRMPNPMSADAWRALVDRLVAACGVSAEGIEYESVDGEPATSHIRAAFARKLQPQRMATVVVGAAQRP